MTVPAVHAWKDNGELIRDVAELGYITENDLVVDATYGRGRFWTQWQPTCMIRHDLHRGDGVDFRDLPHGDCMIDVVVLDPPYKLNGTPALGDFDDRYGVDETMRWQDKMVMIGDGISEAARVLKNGGRLLLKCQDQVCSGQVRWQTIGFTNHAVAQGLRLVDRFDMLGGSRPQPMNGRTQKHAHGRPSTLLVFEKP